MTFVLTPLSHYNSITEPCTRFLLSLLEDLSIDFPTHFITSTINVYQDMATRDKLIFPSAITRILCHFSISIPDSPYYTVISAINATYVARETIDPSASTIPSTFAYSSSGGSVTLEAIKAQLQHMNAHLNTLNDELCQVLCQSYCTMTGSPQWFRCFPLFFSLSFGKWERQWWCW